MNIPARVKIAGLWHVVVRDAARCQSGNNYGECEHINLRLLLDDARPRQRQEQTLVHEILEAINTEYHLKLKHEQIELLETALYQLIEDNPELFAASGVTQ